MKRGWHGIPPILTHDPGYGRFINVSLGPDGEPPYEAVAAARARGLVAIRVELGETSEGN